VLIYNFKKEFIGMDEGTLKTFGFNNLSQLRAESADFADLFVRTPGYVHNFKHVHWIDFVSCAEPSEESKVIIDVNSKTFKANLSINTVFLADNPTEKAYIIYLQQLRELSQQEVQSISEELAQRPTPVGTTEALSLSASDPYDIPETPVAPQAVETPQPLQQEVAPAITPNDDFDAPLDIELDEYDVAETPEVPQSIELDIPEETVTPSQEDDLLSVDDMYDIDDSLDIEEEVLQTTSPTPSQEVQADDFDENFDYDYHYDPQVASDELGLPIDLIEEFIQDFIAQAHEFKDGLYTSLAEGDLANVKVLSHKLKGVAANLRIEDAFEVLTTINTSEDIRVVESYLKTFYKIIARLSGEEVQAVAPQQAQEPQQTPVLMDENDFIIDDPIDEISTNEPTQDEAQQEESISLELEDDDLFSDPVDEQIVSEPTLEEPTAPTNENEDLLDIDLDFEDDFLENESPEETTKTDTTEQTNTQEAADDDLLDLDLDFADEIDEPINEDVVVEDETIPTPSILFSKESAANAIGLDIQTYSELLEDYTQEVQEIITQLEQSLEADDIQTLHLEAQKLKSMSENMHVEDVLQETNNIITSSEQSDIKDSVTTIKAIVEEISK